MPLNEQSRRLTHFVIENQQYEFNKIFIGNFIGPAAFSAFMSKIFRPLILNKKAITYLDDDFMQSQTKAETIKQLAVRIKTLVRKAYSFNTHDYKNTKMTEILMMTLTPQMQKNSNKKESIRSFLNPRTRFRLWEFSR